MSMVINPFLQPVDTVGDVLIDTALFSLNTVTGNQTFNIPTFGGKVPKAAMFEVYPTTGGSEAASSFPLTCKGFTDGITHYAMYCQSDLRRKQQKSSAVFFGFNGTVTFEATFVSFGTDQVTVNLTTAPGAAWKIRVYLFGGNDLEAKVNYVTGVSTTGTSVAVGFEPNFVIALGGLTGSSLVNGSNTSGFSMGIAGSDGAGNIFQRAYATFMSSSSGWDSGYYTGAVVAKSNTGTPSYTITLGSFTIAGFTATANNTNPAAHHMGFLSIGLTGRQTKVGAWATPTEDVSGSLTGLPFQPSRAFMLMPSANGSDNNWQGGGWGYMAIDNVNSNHGYSNFSSSDFNYGYSTTRLRVMHAQNVSNSRSLATLTSFNSDGWTMSFADVPLNVGVTWGYIAIE